MAVSGGSTVVTFVESLTAKLFKEINELYCSSSFVTFPGNTEVNIVYTLSSQNCELES